MKRARTLNPRFPGRGRTTHTRRRLYLPSPVRREVKYFDVTGDTTVVSSTWASSEVACDEFLDPDGVVAAYTEPTLNPGLVGSGYGSVDGLKYDILKLHCRGRIHHVIRHDQANPSIDHTYRLVLVLDTQPNQTQAAGEDVMNAFTTGIESAFKSMSNLPGRFVILKSQQGAVHTMSAPSNFMNPGFINTSGTGTMTPFDQTYDESFKDVYFDFEWVPRSPYRVSITHDNPGAHGVAVQVNCNMFLLLFTRGLSLSCHFASRCYFRD